MLFYKIWWLNNNILFLFSKKIPQKIKSCVYIMHVEFWGSFSDYTNFICKFKIDEYFLFMKVLVYKLEKFKNCKEVKQIMIMIIAILYIILSYVIFDQQLKITFRKFSAPPPWKNPIPLFYSLLPQKFKKCKSPSFCQHWKFFKPPCRKEGHYEHVTLEVTQLDKVELLRCLGEKICPGGGCELATIAWTTAA